MNAHAKFPATRPERLELRCLDPEGLDACIMDLRFRDGEDTHAIAGALMLPEAVVYNTLHRRREKRHDAGSD
jgi:hypothetical protein